MIALYHSDPDLLEFSAEVRACTPVAGADDLYDVVLSNTAFYPTAAASPATPGTLDGFPVEDVSHEGDLAPIVHRVRAPRSLSGVVRGCVDKARRLDFSQQHTGQHMLSHVLCERFDAYSLGLHIGRDDAYVDLAGADAAPMTRALADELEAEVNAWIAQDEPVRCFFPTPEELEALPLRKKPDPHPELRIVCIGSREAVACCGTHARSTARSRRCTSSPGSRATATCASSLWRGCARCAGPGRGPSRRRARRASSPAGRRTSSRPWTGCARRTQTWRTALRSLRASGSPRS